MSRPRAISQAPRSLARSRVLHTLLWGALVILVAAAVNVAGIRAVGSVSGWAHWLQAHRTDFLLWRLCLYGATAWGWVWMRRRVRKREFGSRLSLLRVEIAAVLVILALEGLTLRHP